MPLRSVEAATRDDAIAAAREQFGPSARVVGVRRVRSGGVLGFFATERYVAEVANDPSGRPAVPVPGRSGDAELPAAGYASSPLSAAAPATAAPSSAAPTPRTAAPSRNGAAAWAAAAVPPAPVAAPSSSSRPDDERVSELAGLLGAPSVPASPAASPLYGRTSFPRTPTVRPASPIVFPTEKAVDDSPFVEDYVASRPLLRAEDSAAGPSPFTAALARMVSGDRDVREAVENALDKPAIKRARTDVEPSASWPGSRRSEDTSVPSRPARQEEETVGDQVIAPPSPEAPLAAELPNWAVEPEPATGGSPREEAIAEVLRSALAQGHSDEALAGILRKVLAGDSPRTALATPVAPEAAVVPMTEFDEFAEFGAPAALDPEIAEPATTSLAIALAGVTSGEPEPVAEETAATVFGSPVVDAIAEPVAVEEPASEPEAPAHGSTGETAVDEPILEQSVAPPVEEPASEAPAYLTPGYEMPAYEVPVFQLPPVLTPPSYVSPSAIWGSAADSIWGPSVDSIWGGGTATETPLWGHPGSTRSSVAGSEAPIWDAVARDEQPAADLYREAADDALFAETSAPVEVVEEAPEAIDDALPDVAGSDVAGSDVAGSDVAAEDVEVTVAAEVDAVATAAADHEIAVLEPVLARTASDPAPMSLDATTVMPPLSLLPPLPGTRGRGRPPVPPSPSRGRGSSAQPTAPRTAPASASPAAPSLDGGTAASEPAAPAVDAVESPLATVTRLPLPPHTAPEAPDAHDAAEALGIVETPELPDLFAEVPVEPVAEEPIGEAGTADGTETRDGAAVEDDLLVEPLIAEPAAIEWSATDAEAADVEDPSTDAVGQLQRLGVPGHLLGADFAADVQARGTYAALTRAMGLSLPRAPELPTGAGEVLVVVGPGVETLRAARALAVSLRLDPDRVQWATRGDLAGLAPKGSRMTTVEAAIDRRQDLAHEGAVTIVAVDAPMRTDSFWTARMLAVWSPTAVWAVVEATRKPEDLGPWIDGLPRVDALMVQDTDLSADPAAVLRRVATPVAMIDGVRATPHRWASLLCERLESARP